MPSIQENLRAWGEDYSWPRSGEEWSDGWGGSDALWWTTIHPRVRHFLPAGTILEIAPGHGRWSQFLSGHCERLILVDLAPRCIDACRARFQDAKHVEYHVNDGRSLGMVSDRSVDFVFSFDSLVHADADAIEAYVGELQRTLAPDGVAFLHHSNLGGLRAATPRLLLGKLTPELLHPWLDRSRLMIRRHWRSRSVSAALVRTLCERAELRCIGQELINWGGSSLIDCMSVLTRRGSRRDRTPRLTENPRFMDEAVRARRIEATYAGGDGAIEATVARSAE